MPAACVMVSYVITADITSGPRAVRARGLTKSFGDVVALDGVDLDVEAGQVHGVLGRDGAGKTTLLGLLLGVDTADGGILELLGHRTGTVPDGVTGFSGDPGLYPSLTARGNLSALALLRGPGPAGPSVDDVLAQTGLSDVADDPVRYFSLGMRQRLGLAAALLIRPRLVVLDEPAAGLDPAGLRHVRGTLARLAADGAAIVISGDRMDDLMTLCSEVTILAAGRVVFSGPLVKLADGNDLLDYRLRTSDPGDARRVAAATDGVTVTGDGPDPEMIMIRASVPALDELVSRLVRTGIAIRELSPVVPPLEAAFAALTGALPCSRWRMVFTRRDFTTTLKAATLKGQTRTCR